jgi:glycosyltransferase involved in cell wall biosynthesis
MVEMIIHKKRGVEDHSNLLKIHYLPYSRLSRIFLSIFSKKTIDNFGIPNPLVLIKNIYSFKPDIIIIKQMKLSGILASFIGRLIKSKLVLLTDTPVNQDSNLFAILKRLGIVPNLQIRVTGFGLPGSIHYNNFRPMNYLIKPYPVLSPYKNHFKDSNHKKIIIVSIGSFENKRKKQWLLIEAINIIKNPNIELHLIGFGNENSYNVLQCQKLASNYKLENKIKYIYNLPHSQIFNHLIKSNLFVLPSSNEPYGVVIPEAMAAGLPVICSDTCGSKNCVYEKINGHVFKSDSFIDLADKIINIIDNNNLKVYSRHSKIIFDNYISSESWYRQFEKDFLT